VTHERLQPLKAGSNIVLDLKNMLESNWSILTRSKSVTLLPQRWLLLLLKSTWTGLLKNFAAGKQCHNGVGDNSVSDILWLLKPSSV